MKALKVLVEASSLENPLAHAWILALRSAGIIATGLLRSDGASALVKPYADCWIPAGSGSEHVQDVLAGPPSTVLHWWGFDEARKSIAATWFPNATRVLYVDTYPNASRPLTELREVVRNRGTARKIDVTVAYTTSMAAMLRRRGMTGRRTVSMIQPYPRVMHAGDDVPQPDLHDRGVVFTGRSDQLLGSRKGLEKDAVHDVLTSWIACGVPVTVQRPHNEDHARRLIDQGYRLYDRFAVEDVFSGNFSRFVSMFAAQLAVYQVSTSTVRRRVRGGLSSRFSLGMTAAAPLLVQPEAVALAGHLTQAGIGGVVDDPRRALEDGLGVRLPLMRQTWRDGHETWTAEGMADELRSVLCSAGVHR